jgi:hypothetical protein
MSFPVPANYLGLWRRTVFEHAGKRDVESCVLWLQTRCWHGDLRIPPGRPDFSQTRSLQECTRAQLLWLQQQEGFAGITRVDGDICEWQRRHDYRPTGLRDIGRMVCFEQTIEEYGVEQEYFEHWLRVPIVAAQYSACRAGVQDKLRILVRAGEYFLYFRPRTINQGEAERLRVEARAICATDDALRLLADFEISFGVVDEASGWRILHSTLPWREGSVLSLEDNWVELDDCDDKNGRRLCLNG